MYHFKGFTRLIEDPEIKFSKSNDGTGDVESGIYYNCISFFLQFSSVLYRTPSSSFQCRLDLIQSNSDMETNEIPHAEPAKPFANESDDSDDELQDCIQ